MSGLPTGTVTFLFTDLEGSTRLWEEHPDDMRVALARHDEILRKTVEAHDGAIVKTTGDGLHAAFTTADHALGAAIDAQLALTGEVWPLPEPLRVRMGIHTGAAEERDGDYYGPAVNRAARVAAAAHGGQILVSHATEELARDTLPPGAALVDLGEHRLRDLARAERVFQLTAAGIATDFPPPRTADAYPGNLPVQLSSFVGRDGDVAAISANLREARLVTLTGVGGVGKTRLATQVAAELLPSFPDGAWLCELAAASDGDALEQVVVATLGITPRTGATLQGSIIESLAAKDLLLVLDNCEHLLDQAGALAEAVLRGCPRVRIVATSREGLGIEGEHLRVVRSLPLPDPTDEAADIAAAEATRLFVDRARTAHGDIALDGDGLHAVAEICRRLDGIPLAIELAAARTVSMVPREIAGHLDERFRLLTGGRRTAVERHHTLRATVDWSYSLLDERERVVFDRLGAFSGAFDTAAAEAVAAGDDLETWDVRDALADLVAKSMVVREPQTDATRFTLLETLRQYARERLDERDEADEVRRRHAAYYAELARTLEAGLRSADELAYRARFVEDLDNFRAAVIWALDREDADRDLGLLIIAHLALEAAMDRPTGVGSWGVRAQSAAETADPWIRSAVLGAAAEECRTRADSEGAVRFADAALRDGADLPGPGPTLALVVRAIVLGLWGRGLEGVEPLVAALRRLRTMRAGEPPTYELAWMTAVAGTMASFTDANALARELADDAVDVARVLGAPSVMAGALFARGHAIEDEFPDEALQCFEESIAIVRSGASGSALPASLSYAAMLWHRLGNLTMGLQRAIECVEHTWAVGDLSQIANGFSTGAAMLADTGDLRDAVVMLSGGMYAGPTVNYIVENDPHLNLPALRERLREELGDTAYDAAWREGLELPTDQLVAFAITVMRTAQASLASEPTE